MAIWKHVIAFSKDPSGDDSLCLSIPASSASICILASSYSEWSSQTSSVNIIQELVQRCRLRPALTYWVEPSCNRDPQGFPSHVQHFRCHYLLKQVITDFWIMNNSQLETYIVRYWWKKQSLQNSAYFSYLVPAFSVPSLWPYSSLPPFLPVTAFLSCNLCTVNINVFSVNSSLYLYGCAALP